MKTLEKALTANGFHAVRIGYRSTSAGTPELADRAWDHAQQVAAQFERVHFVTHSMGGILTRRILQRHTPANVGRVVMLAPPNQGSEVVDNLGQVPFVRWAMGPAFCELGTGPDGPRSLGPMRVPTLVIAGTKTQWPFSRYFDGVNDGKVSLASAMVEGAEAMRAVHTTHTRLVRDAEVIRLVVDFLKRGSTEPGGGR